VLKCCLFEVVCSFAALTCVFRYVGDKVLIENIGETVDPVLEPLLGRNTIKKGKYIKIGDKECEYHPDFK